MPYLIKNAKYGFTKGGYACGPLIENVVATVEYADNDKTMYLSVVDVVGFYEYYLSENDIFDKLINEEFDEDIENSSIKSFKGIDLDNLNDLSNSDDDLLIIYLSLILKLDKEKTEELIEESVGKHLNINTIIKYDYFGKV